MTHNSGGPQNCSSQHQCFKTRRWKKGDHSAAKEQFDFTVAAGGYYSEELSNLTPPLLLFLLFVELCFMLLFVLSLFRAARVLLCSRAKEHLSGALDGRSNLLSTPFGDGADARLHFGSARSPQPPERGRLRLGAGPMSWVNSAPISCGTPNHLHPKPPKIWPHNFAVKNTADPEGPAAASAGGPAAASARQRPPRLPGASYHLVRRRTSRKARGPTASRKDNSTALAPGCARAPRTGQAIARAGRIPDQL